MEWRLAETKNRFSEVVNRTSLEGVQPNFKEFLLKQIPKLDDLDLNRNRSKMRDIDLVNYSMPISK